MYCNVAISSSFGKTGFNTNQILFIGGAALGAIGVAMLSTPSAKPAKKRRKK
jgi:hypothetical protein